MQNCNNFDSFSAAASNFTDAFDALFWLPATMDMSDFTDAFDALFWLPVTIDFDDVSLAMIQLFDKDASVHVDLNCSELVALFVNLRLDDITDMVDLSEVFDEMFWLPATLDMADLTEAFEALFWLPVTIDFDDFSLEMIKLFEEDAHVIPTAPAIFLSGSSSAYDMAMKTLFAARQPGCKYHPISPRSLQKIRRQLFGAGIETDEDEAHSSK